MVYAHLKNTNRHPIDFRPRIRHYPKKVAEAIVDASRQKSVPVRSSLVKKDKTFSEVAKISNNPKPNHKPRKSNIDPVPDSDLAAANGAKKRSRRNRSKSQVKTDADASRSSTPNSEQNASDSLGKSNDKPAWLDDVLAHWNNELEKRSADDRAYFDSKLDSLSKTKKKKIAKALENEKIKPSVSDPPTTVGNNEVDGDAAIDAEADELTRAQSGIPQEETDHATNFVTKFLSGSSLDPSLMDTSE